jgi:hypothetical protein
MFANIHHHSDNSYCYATEWQVILLLPHTHSFRNTHTHTYTNIHIHTDRESYCKSIFSTVATSCTCPKWHTIIKWLIFYTIIPKPVYSHNTEISLFPSTPQNFPFIFTCPLRRNQFTYSLVNSQFQKLLHHGEKLLHDIWLIKSCCFI